MHIHAAIDFVVTAWIVHKRSLLMVKHKKLGLWLPIGGHIELGETPDEALAREIMEETSLDIDDFEFYKPDGSPFCPPLADISLFDQLEIDNWHAKNNNSDHLLTPWFVDVHDFPPIPGHRHVSLNYLFYSPVERDQVRLNRLEHEAIDWFHLDDVPIQWALAEALTLDVIKYYGKEAILQTGRD